MGEDDTTKVLVDAEVVIEGAGVLGGDIDGPSECRPRLSVERMTVGRRMDIWARLVDGRICIFLVSGC
jgi:hypothetical protein